MYGLFMVGLSGREQCALNQVEALPCKCCHGNFNSPLHVVFWKHDNYHNLRPIPWRPLFHFRVLSGFCCTLLSQPLPAILEGAPVVIMRYSFRPSFGETHPAKLFLGVAYVVPLW